MTFWARPQLLPLLGAALLWALLAAAHFRWKARRLPLLGDPDLLRRLAPPESPRRQRVKALLSVTAAALLALALAGPRWGRTYQDVRRRGADVMIAVDVSASMMAEDVPPNRLTQAKRALGRLIEGLDGDRVGVVAFAGTAFLQCPLTLDRAAARSLLELVDGDLIPVPGTDLAAALETSLGALPPSSGAHPAVVLLTDGEDHSHRLEEAAKRLADRGVRVFAVGIGAPAGEVIPVKDERGNLVDYKKDRSGKTVVSRLDEAALQKLARATGGAYYRAGPSEAEVDRLLEDLGALDKRSLDDRTLDRSQDRSAWPLAAAVLLLIVELLWPERKLSGVLLLLALALPAPPLRAMGRAPDDRAARRAAEGWEKIIEKDPRNADAHAQKGQALARAGDPAGAAEAFARAGELWADPARRAEAAYNAGTSLALAQKGPEALEQLKAALRLNPADLDAKRNYEFLKRQMKKGGGKSGADGKEGSDGKKEKAPAEAAPAPRPGDLSKEDAERVLQAVERQEKEARRKVKIPAPKATTEEDW